jgi:hypothetical protein
MPQSRRIAVVLLLCAAIPRVALAQAQFNGPDGTHMSGVVIECQGAGAPLPCGSAHTPLVTVDGGVAGTGLVPPSGGSGDLGFLSGILGALSNTLSVTVTNMPLSQTVPATVGLSGSLPAFASAPTVNLGTALPAGTNALGSVVVSNFPGTQPVNGTVTANDGGTAIAGATLPTGGSGLNGWASAIWSKLAGTLSVSGSVGITGTLPGFASTPTVTLSAGLPAGSNAIGSVSVSNLPSTQVVSGTIADTNSAAFQGAVPITPGTALAAGRAIGFICSASGNITLTIVDGSTITLPITVANQFQTFTFAVTNVALGSGTAGTFWNLK